MIQIVEVSDRRDLLTEAIHVFWKQWGSNGNYQFYANCISNSLNKEIDLPKFYIALVENSIIGTYALLRNDLISRQDLYPWVACLYVDEHYRGKEIGKQLLDHAVIEASKRNFHSLYLSTDLEGYYEKCGWTYMDDGYGVSGESIKIYKKDWKS